MNDYLSIIILGYILGLLIIGFIGFFGKVNIFFIFLILTLLIILLISSYIIWMPLFFKKMFSFLLSLIAGIIWFYWSVDYQLWKMPTSLVGKNMIIDGKVLSINQKNRDHITFFFETDQFNGLSKKIKLHLNWYFSSAHLALASSKKIIPTTLGSNLQSGDCWQLVVRLKPPHGLHNPGSFDYERWLWLQGISATGYVVNNDQDQLLNKKPSLFLYWRQSIQQVIENSVSSPKIAALLSALTVGLRDGFTQDMWSVLQRTGTNHLVVIAGLHLGLLMSTFYFILYHIIRFYPNFLLLCPAKRSAAMVTLVFAWCYALLAGFSVPTERAAWMLTLFFISHWFYRNISAFRKLLITAALVLLFEPMAVFTASFWLSFAACFWIVYGMVGEVGSGKLKKWFKIQWIISLGIMPLTLYYFQQAALASILTNLIAIPWVGFFIVPLGFLTSLLALCHLAMSKWLFYWLGFALAPLWKILQWFSSHPVLQWHHSIVSSWILVTSSIAIILLLAPPGWPARWLGLFWLLPIAYYRLPIPGANELWVTMLDVGQGLSVVARTSHHTLVYDTGASIGGFDAGADILLPYLNRSNITQLDLLIVSHGDNDHSGGAKALLQQLPVKRFLTSIPSLFAHSKPKLCQEGLTGHLGGWRWQILSPLYNEPYADNNSSCVLKLSRGQQSILFTGDIEAEQETQLIHRWGDQLKAEVLIVPHHGSKTSSTESFLETISPSYALFSLGYYNRYHFPNAEVVNRYHKLGIHTLFTDTAGAITLKFSSTGSKPTLQVQTMNKIGYNVLK